MDAAHNLLKKIALFLAIALLVTIPSFAQSQLSVSSSTVNLNNDQAQTVTVTTASTSPESYSVLNAPFWLRVTSQNGFSTSSTTPDTLFFQLGNSSCGTCTATVSLHATGSSDVPITVTYSPGSTGSNGTLTANPASLTFNALSGQTAATQNVTISTTTSTVSFTTATDQSWLSAQIISGSFTVTPNSPATLQVFASAVNLSNGTYTGHVTLTPTVGTATTITVTFNVGTSGGTGTINANPSSLTFNAASGQSAAAQTVSLTTASTNSIQILGVASDVSWLFTNLSSSFVSSVSPSTLTVQASASNLGNGTYVGHLTIQPSTGTNTVITVTFNVGTGGSSGTTILATPGSLTFSAQSGQISSAQTVTLTTTSTTPLSVSYSQDASWIQTSVIGGNLGAISSSAPVTLSIFANASNLGNGTQFGHIFLTPSSGSATTINLTLNVGTSGGGGTGTITASQTNFTFAYPSNTLAAVLTVGSSNPSVTSASVTINTSNNWLLFQGVGNGSYPNVGFGSYNLSVNTSVAASLGTGTYPGTITLTNPNNPNDVTTVNVTLNVNGGGGTGGGTTALTVQPGSILFTAFPGGLSQSQNVTVTAPSNQTVTLTATSFNGPFYTISSPVCNITPNSSGTCSFTGSQVLTVTINPGNLTVIGSYTGGLSLVSGSSSAQASLALSLISPVSSLQVTPTALAFSAASGGTAQTQDVTVAVPSGSQVTLSLSSFNGNFFSVTTSNCSANPSTAPTCNFTGNQTIQVTVNPANLTVAGNYNGIIQVQSGGVTQNITVALTLTSGGGGGGGNGGGTASIAAPASLAFYYQTNTATFVPQQYIAVGSVGTFSIQTSVTTSQQWLIASPSSTTGPGYVTVSVSPSGLPAGVYQGTVTVNSSAGSLSIPVTLTVSNSVVLESNPGDIYFTFQSSTQSVQETITISASDNSATPVTASSSTSWITVGSGSSSTTPSSFQVTLSPQNLCNGLNVGSIAVSAPSTANGGITVPVVVYVSGSTATNCGGGTTSSLTVSPSSLSFSASSGQTPAAQTISVSSTSGQSGLAFTYTVTGNVSVTATVNGTTIQNGQSLSTPSQITITPNTSGLAPGATYSGTITLTPSSGTAVTVPISLTISASSVTATPTSLTFAFAAGSSAPAPQSVTVGGTSGSTFTATASSTGNWLSVSPTSGTVPSTLSVSVNPASLSAGTYNGTITVAATGSSTGTTTINVSLTVTAPLPTITSLGSAASYAGGSISPGEIITIFGTSIGPTPGVSLTLDSSGKVSTTLGGVQVLVNGVLAPMIYASNTQVSAVVPYELCTSGCGPGTIAQVSVKFLGQASNGIPTPVAATTTAIFTANASGSGQGAILNANSSANSPGNPANKGDIVAIYLTGEGQTSPGGVTGKVTTVASTNPITPVPLLPVGVTIDGTPVSISFAGEAPGLVSGVMQLNVQIPANARSGSLPVVVTIGSASSQAGVTVAVR
ncbi:MAG TPA: hypothetical protein VKU19_28715 [Bryobacteraceae bacterium]|nr:hypothetical protein [Bryobacteraceae bacterium]